MPEYDLIPIRSALVSFSTLGRTALLPALIAAQSIYGYIPEPVAIEVSQTLGVPLADVYGAIEFYSMLYSTPVGKRIIRVCTDPSCALRGGEEVLSSICQYLGANPGQPVPDGSSMVEQSQCLGFCEHAPAIQVDETSFGYADNKNLDEICYGTIERPKDLIGGDIRVLTANCGTGSPTSLERYTSGGGYSGLRKALTSTPDELIREITASGLVGRGGAAFPSGIKWESAANAIGVPKFVVCNADESEPGTFKDRVLLEGDPHLIIEGMIIAAYAIGAHKGYIYLRGEYTSAHTFMTDSLSAALESNYLGDNILGLGFNFDIELRSGAGAYICGEETALFESIEGKRGFPRAKPPFPTTHGLFRKPTLINNVETLCNVPYIIQNGAANYRRFGTRNSPGPKLFCLSGDVEQPGSYEVPFGVTLRHLIYNLAGGINSGNNLQAILLGGAAGTFATPDQLDIKMTFEDLSAAGLSLGSGAVMVFDETRDMTDILVRLGRFFTHESCGKCYPCQLGTQRQYEILARITSGNTLPGDTERLKDIGWTMSDASICGLGQTAATTVLSALELWPQLFTPTGHEK
jgi:NADH-quinone oxidoreductase subunit F